ncbi:MAG: cyclophilin-like fold protein [Desulfobacteraceae bacterium]|jgi:uncharacterized protein
MKILVRIQDVELAAELNDSPTANAIADALPLEGGARVWGEEIYFDIPVIAPLEENAVAEVEIGTLAYWPAGSAFCIFFGPTPVSTNDKPRAYSPVNVIGRIVEDTAPLKTIADGAPVSIATRR